MSWVEGIGQISSWVKGISTNFIALSSLWGHICLIPMLSFAVVGAWVLENGRRTEVCYMVLRSMCYDSIMIWWIECGT